MERISVMQLYIVRHGQSQNNAGIASSHNVPLTHLGCEQVRRAADALTDQHFDALYCSPLERALQTAFILHSTLGIAPYAHPAFSETGFSWGEPDATREQLHAAYPNFVLDESITSNGWAPADQETESEAYERACKIVQWICIRHPEPESRVLVVTHGNFGGILIGSLVGVRPSGYTRFSQHNACISRADIVGGQNKLRFLNATAHLPKEMLT
jgi:broad specificity phosphatase PhoE